MGIPRAQRSGLPVWSGARTTVAAAGALPEVASLHVVGANPFREATSLALALPRDASGRAAIYDIGGRHVRTLAEGVIPAGREEIRWDGRDEEGTLVGAGVYFFDLRTDQINRRERLVLVK